GRKVLVGVGDYCLIVYNADQRPDTAVLSGSSNSKRFDLIFGNIISVGIQGFEHGIDSLMDELFGIYLIHVIRIYFFKEGGENIKALCNVEIFFNRPPKDKDYNNQHGQDRPSKSSPHDQNG